MYTLTTPQKNDYPTLLAIWEASVRATHDFLNEDDIAFFKRIIQEKEIFDHVQLTTVQNEEADILGFMGILGNSLEMIFLAPHARGRKIGRLLLRHGLDQFHVTKVDVNEQNEEALKFYEHFGFKVVSRSELDATGKPYPILHMELE